MKSQPLADRMRPTTLDDFIGQEHLTAPGALLHQIIFSDRIPSMIFWGPPGTGKTTLARIIASTTNSIFHEISAVTSGVADIKQIVSEAKNNPELQTDLFQPHTQKSKTSQPHNHILFIDEIHRFNKSQQDALLPHVESGLLTLIGATTENPSFEVNNALLSRTRVLTLKQLEITDLITIINNALNHKTQGYGELNMQLNPDNQQLIAKLANGDARTALNILELTIQLSSTDILSSQKPRSEAELRFRRIPSEQPTIHITREHILQAAQSTALHYDRAGEEHYNTISAFIKSMRASDTNAALYYLARMVEGGEDPKFIARRMVIFASEDIGMANPNALLLANQVFRTCEIIGYPECAINLAHGVTYLAQSPKDRRAYDALQSALTDVKQHGNLPIPLEVRNAPTKLMKESGYGKNYQMYPDKTTSYLPDQLKGKKYYK